MSPITYLVLRRVPDETLAVGEGDVRRRRAVTHVVGDDLNPAREKRSASKFLTRQSSSSSSSSIARVTSSSPSSRFPRSVAMRSRAVAAETPRASRLDLEPSPPPDDRPTETHTKKKTRASRVPSRASRVASPPTTARPSSLSPPFASRASSHRSPPRRRKTPDPIHRASDSNAPIVLPDTDARIRRAEIDPDRGTFSLTHDDSRWMSRSREMSSRRRVEGVSLRKKLFEGGRGCVRRVITRRCRVSARPFVFFSSVRFMDDKDV